MNLGPYELGPNDTPENGIYTGDARELAQSIPDESIDLIFTDPVYQNIEDYQWLAETGATVLRQNRACLAWTATATLPSVLEVMRLHLDYAWLLYWQRYGPINMRGRTGPSVIVPCIWMEKGRSILNGLMADWVGTANDGRSQTFHRWSKPPRVLVKWLGIFTKHGALIFDPFTGGGTVPAVCKMLGRKYLAFEIDPETAEMARERVRMTQPPLFVPLPEQSEMRLSA